MRSILCQCAALSGTARPQRCVCGDLHVYVCFSAEGNCMRSVSSGFRERLLPVATAPAAARSCFCLCIGRSAYCSVAALISVWYCQAAEARARGMFARGAIGSQTTGSCWPFPTFPAVDFCSVLHWRPSGTASPRNGLGAHVIYIAGVYLEGEIVLTAWHRMMPWICVGVQQCQSRVQRM